MREFKSKLYLIFKKIKNQFVINSKNKKYSEIK